MKLIDFEFLHEISDGDPSYICDVLDIFLDTVPPAISNLEHLINEAEDWDAIYKQAHTLKSSLGIVKIADIHNQMAEIEKNAMSEKNKQKAQEEMITVLKIFNEAHPIIISEREVYRSKRPN